MLHKKKEKVVKKLNLLLKYVNKIASILILIAYCLSRQLPGILDAFGICEKIRNRYNSNKIATHFIKHRISLGIAMK